MQVTSNFLQKGTAGFYRHAPVLSFNEKSRLERLLAPAQQTTKKPVVLATQTQMQDKYRKRGWKLVDQATHPFTPGFAKVYELDGVVTVIYPDASVSRHQGRQVNYDRGWWSAQEIEAQRQRANNKMVAGQRRLLPPPDLKAMAASLMKVFK